MRPIILLFALFGTIYALPFPLPQFNLGAQAYITRYDSTNDGFGTYSYNVETSDGTNQEEHSEVINTPEGPSLKVTGQYSYVGPDGVTYTVIYVADENGFHPAGEHIPPAAGTDKKVPQLGIPSAAVASLAGGGLG